MPGKAQVAARMGVRRGLDENEAAVYLSLSPSFFRKLVEMKVMPRPRGCENGGFTGGIDPRFAHWRTPRAPCVH